MLRRAGRRRASRHEEPVRPSAGIPLSPVGFTARIRRNAFTERWHGREDELERKVAVEGPRYRQAFEQGDPDHTAVWFGEACGMIGAIEPAGEIVERIAADAARRIEHGTGAALG